MTAQRHDVKDSPTLHDCDYVKGGVLLKGLIILLQLCEKSRKIIFMDERKDDLHCTGGKKSATPFKTAKTNELPKLDRFYLLSCIRRTLLTSTNADASWQVPSVSNLYTPIDLESPKAERCELPVKYRFPPVSSRRVFLTSPNAAAIWQDEQLRVYQSDPFRSRNINLSNKSDSSLEAQRHDVKDSPTLDVRDYEVKRKNRKMLRNFYPTYYEHKLDAIYSAAIQVAKSVESVMKTCKVTKSNRNGAVRMKEHFRNGELQIFSNDEKKDVLHCIEEKKTATPLKTDKTTFVGCEERKISVLVNDLVNEIHENAPCWIEKLEFSSCNVTKTHLEELWSGIKNADVEISKLCIDYNRESVEELILMCCEIFNRYNTTSLSLAFGKLNVEAMQMLSKGLKGRELGELNINYNQDIDLDGYEVLGKILRKHKVKTLRAADCNISDAKIQKLFSPPGEDKESRLEVLDISWSKNLSATSFMRLGKLVRDGRILQLKLSGVDLTEETLQAFHDELPQNEEVLLADLDVSYNSTMEPKAYGILGSIVKTCSVKKLSLAGCDVEKGQILNLRENTKEHKMISLDASDNSSIGNNIIELAKFVSERNLDELDISDCNLFAHELKEFRSVLGNKTKLKSLILGDRNNELGEKYISEVCDFFPNITEKVHLKFRTLRGGCRDLLQNRRAELKASTLEIILNEKEAL